VRCVVDTTNDPAEVSLDENFSRETLHPADQFEAFKDLAERKGYGAEEIAARYGIKPDTVRERLRLGAAAPELLDLYREEALTLEQVTAFAVNPDVARQLQVYQQLAPHGLQAYAIRRAMVEDKVVSTDRRAQFVGVEAYEASGGPVLRDLFSQAGGVCWLEDVGLLERLVVEKLAAIAEETRQVEGWKWASAHIDFPQGHGLARVWQHYRQRAPGESEAINALLAEDAELTEQWADVEPPPPEVAARFEEIAAELEAYGDEYGWDPEEKARAGIFVVLNQYGEPRIEPGFVRPEDEPAPEPEAETEGPADMAQHHAEEGAASAYDEGGDAGAAGGEAEEPTGDPAAPLPDRVIAELTAHRTAALRDALAQDHDLALVALVHALVSRVFGMGGFASCLDIRWGSKDLTGFGEGIDDSPAGLAIAERHRTWARQMPTQTEDFWDFVVGLDADSRAALLAHCVSLTLDGVKAWERRPWTVMAHVETLATALDLDMRAYWKPTAVRYLDRVTKAHIVAAVADGVSAEAAGRLAGLKKSVMIEIAEPALVAARWLPAILRTATPQPVGETAPADQLGAPCAVAWALAEEVEPPLSEVDLAPSEARQSDDEAAEVAAILEATE
jgi:ParB family chromosome partitioning protein